MNVAAGIPTNAHFDFFLKRSISLLHANWKETQFRP